MKKCVKMSILLLIVAIIIGIMPNVVKATDETTEETLQKMIKVLPDEMNIDLKESEYEKASDAVEQNVRKIWKENGINVQKLEEQGYDFGFGTSYLHLTQEQFYQASVYIDYINEDGSISSTGKEKTIQLIYNNHDKYSKVDEQTIKNLQIDSLGYHEVSIDLLKKNQNVWEEYFKIVENDYAKLLKDKTITVKAGIGAGGSDGTLNLRASHGRGLSLAVFKNDILYDIKGMGSEISVPVITVPSNIADNEINNYVLNKIKSTYNSEDYNWNNATITKGATITSGYGDNSKTKEIPDGYTVEHTDIFDGSKIKSYIIIRKEKTESSVVVEDKETNVKLEANSNVVPSDTVLEVKPIQEISDIKTILSDVNNFVAYDITLKSKGVEIQPNGKVKIMIPVPNNFDTNNLVVYRVNGKDKVKYNVTIQTINNIKYAVFETDHFSTYVLGELKQETNNSNKGELDETPKTGTIDLTFYILPVAIISIAGIIATIKRKQAKH